jgi:hypothetical protein
VRVILKSVFFALLVLDLGLGLLRVNASAATPPAPYTGGAAVVKVLHPADGSTVTITATGAVIKQSPGDTPYREGWVSTCNIGSINEASDLQGQIQPGSSNPFSSNCNNAQSTSSAAATTTPATNPAVTITNTNQAQAQSSSLPSPTSQAQTQSTPAATQTQTAPAAQTQAQTAPTVTTAASTTTSTSGKGATTLPNTGPGAAVPLVGATSVFAGFGHYFFARRRLK